MLLNYTLACIFVSIIYFTIFYLLQNEMESRIASVFYIEQLVRHAQPELKEKRPKKKLLANLQPLSKVLADLEGDLHDNSNQQWVKEFVSSPNHGHVALIDLIKDIADFPTTIQRKHSKKYTVLDREPVRIYCADIYIIYSMWCF